MARTQAFIMSTDDSTSVTTCTAFEHDKLTRGQLGGRHWRARTSPPLPMLQMSRHGAPWRCTLTICCHRNQHAVFLVFKRQLQQTQTQS